MKNLIVENGHGHYSRIAKGTVYVIVTILFTLIFGFFSLEYRVSEIYTLQHEIYSSATTDCRLIKWNA
jgi:hypothetical protein